MTMLLDKLWVVIRRDLLTSLRLRAGLAQLFSLLLEVFGLYYLARSIGPGFRPNGMDYFAFATVGTAFITFLMAGMGVFVHLIQEWQSGGTLEVLFNSRTTPVSVVLINALPVLLRYAVTLFITFLAAYALISGNALQLNLGGALLVFVLSALLVCCLGLLAAALQVLFRKGSALLWLSGSSAWLLCGAMYPVEALPAGLQSLSALVPVTYAITAFRKVLLQGASLRDTNPSLTILIALLLVLGPLSVFVFSVSVNAAKRRGLLAYF